MAPHTMDYGTTRMAPDTMDYATTQMASYTTDYGRKLVSCTRLSSYTWSMCRFTSAHHMLSVFYIYQGDEFYRPETRLQSFAAAAQYCQGSLTTKPALHSEAEFHIIRIPAFVRPNTWV